MIQILNKSISVQQQISNTEKTTINQVVIIQMVNLIILRSINLLEITEDFKIGQ